ncbi:MAG: alpha-L-rhamnosidase N-terminal domain-containing protein [Phycisphaerales bacterium]|nr:alpha-L-rhamnosidase N-terminal domain-containing protein [Phycisphaerales bacterium]
MHTTTGPVLALCAFLLASPAAAQPQWIAPTESRSAAPCPQLRREFTLPADATSATVRIVGLGHYELRCNGKIVGDTIINQAWSQYDKTLYYQDFDLGPLLRPGENVLAVTLGNSFWWVGPANDPQRFTKTDAMPDFSAGEPHLLWLAARIQTPAGEHVIASDDQWKWADSPIVYSNIYAGEDFDARLIQPGWDSPGFDDSAWKPVRIAPPRTAALAPSPAPGIRAFDVFAPTEIKNPAPGIHTYIFPQNCSALLRFTVDGGKAGDRIRFKPCEYMDDAGRVKFTYTWGTKKDIWHDYTKRSAGSESHQVIFCYVGAQLVEVQGAVPDGEPNPDNLPVIRSLEQVHTRVDCPIVGEFESNSDLHNGAARIIDWAIRSNMAHVPTDCPHREKNGWLEQNWHMARSISYRHDIHGWFRKVCRDMRDAQTTGGKDDGFIPTNAPWYLVGRPRHDTYNDAPEWAISSVLVPWHLYEWYGDRVILEESYDCARRYIDYLASTAKDGIITTNLGDWYDFGHGKGNGPSQWTPAEVSATAIWIYGTDTLCKIAEVLGKSDDLAKYRKMHESTRAAFMQRFYDPTTKTIKNGGSCQAGNSMALCLGLCPKEDRPAVLQGIVDDLEKRGYQQTPGEVLHIFLIRALAENNRGDLLHRIYNRDQVASYGAMIKSGLTTLPESWDGRKGTGDSLNHLMLGHLMEWHHAYVCGIRQQPGSIGWKKILIAPQPPSRTTDRDVNAITTASADFASPAGQISVQWNSHLGEFTFECLVPAGIEAQIVLPDGTVRAAAAGHTRLTCKMP